MATNSYETIRITDQEDSTVITLARPQVRNAFNEEVIAELIDALRSRASGDGTRVLVLTGEGDVFSAGADLNWMKKMAAYDYEENLDDARKLSELLEVLYTFPGATIARVNGPAIGGGVGLVAACDVSIASEGAFFSLSEVRLGLVPSCIAPYVIRRIGGRYAREYFLTGKRFDAAKALEMGLVNGVVAPSKLDDEVGRWRSDFLACGPEAVKSCKELIARSMDEPVGALKEYTAGLIADLRVSPEGKEGITSFFDKRKPKWDKSGRDK